MLQKQAKLVPIGKERPNPLDINPPNPVISKLISKQQQKQKGPVVLKTVKSNKTSKTGKNAKTPPSKSKSR